MKVLKSTKSVDYSSNIYTSKKTENISIKQNLITKLKIVNIVDKRKVKKNFNISSDRFSSEKFEFLNNQEIQKSKTPKNFTQNNFNTNSNSNFGYNYENNLRNNLSNESTHNNNNHIKPGYNIIDLNFQKKNSLKNIYKQNNNSKHKMETDPNENNLNNYFIPKNTSNKNIINNNYTNTSGNKKFIHKNSKSNINGNFNPNFNLFLKPKISVNIINNNNNNNNISNNENPKFVNSSRGNNKKSINYIHIIFFRLIFNFTLIKYILKLTSLIGISIDRKFSNSIDFSNPHHLKNKLSTTNNHKRIKNESNYVYDTKNYETESEIKNMIQNELVNSLVKENMAYPLSPQNRKSTLLNKYVK